VPLYPLLSQVAKALDEWNRYVFGNLFRRKRELWHRIEGIQDKWPHNHNPYLIKLEASLRKELDEVLGQIETFWFQKPRTEAIQDGDRNTHFYHLSTVIRRKVNHIEVLQDQYGNFFHSILCHADN